MSNNRGNNRRRGRGNNRQQGGQQLNRIDSRARGNAPQLLEKYRKLAHDAHLNGDRVTEEYYLQFADHYFRVIADTKARQEETRHRRDDRWQDNDVQRGDGDDLGEDEAYGSERYERADDGQDGDSVEESRGSDGEIVYEPDENPFLRGNREPRGAKPRRPRRSGRDDGAADTEAGEEPVSQSAGRREKGVGLDPSALPPSISAAGEQGEEDTPKNSAPKPRRRSTRSANPPADDADESLQAVN